MAYPGAGEINIIDDVTQNGSVWLTQKSPEIFCTGGKKFNCGHNFGDVMGLSHLFQPKDL